MIEKQLPPNLVKGIKEELLEEDVELVLANGMKFKCKKEHFEDFNKYKKDVAKQFTRKA